MPLLANYNDTISDILRFNCYFLLPVSMLSISMELEELITLSRSYMRLSLLSGVSALLMTSGESTGSQGVVPEPAVPTSPENVSKIGILGS